MHSSDRPTRGRDAQCLIETAEQFEAIGSPVRLEMVEFFGSRGPMSVAELAEALALIHC